MGIMLKKLALSFSLLLLASSAEAANVYRVSLQRADDNLYHVIGTQFYIKTRFCFAFDRDALLYWNYKGSFSNELVFLGYDGKPTGSRCRIDRLFVETDL
jgi:hypothetical protein